MAVRPFYIDAYIEGRQTHLSGTRSKRGSQEIHIYQRDKGAITNPYKIVQSNVLNENGDIELRTEVYYQGDLIHTHITDY